MSASHSESSDNEKKKVISRGRRGRSRRTDSEEFFSSKSKPDEEQARKSSRRHASNSSFREKKLEVIESLNDLSTNAVDYRNYRFASKSFRFDFGVTSKTHQMLERSDVQMKTHIFSGKDR